MGIGITISLILLLPVGYFLMGQVDRFINHNIISDYNDDISEHTKQSAVLIQGNNRLSATIIDYCHSHHILFESIQGSREISNHFTYKCLLALSDQDKENLTIGAIGYKVYNIPKMIALCNNPIHMKLYREFNFNQVLPNTENPELLIHIIKEYLHNVIQKEA